MIIDKSCSKCKEVKPVSEFYRDKRNRNGLHSWCKTCVDQESAKYYQKNREKRLADAKAHGFANRPQRAAANRLLYQRQKGTPEGEADRLRRKARRVSPQSLARRKQKALTLRALAYEALGGAFCVCCGETTFRLLSLDHIDNKGAEHRRSDGTTRDMYAWFIKNGMPKGILQVMCMGCNWGKHANGGRCPHEDERKQFIDIAAFSAQQQRAA